MTEDGIILLINYVSFLVHRKVRVDIGGSVCESWSRTDINSFFFQKIQENVLFIYDDIQTEFNFKIKRI